MSAEVASYTLVTIVMWACAVEEWRHQARRDFRQYGIVIMLAAVPFVGWLVLGLRALGIS